VREVPLRVLGFAARLPRLAVDAIEMTVAVAQRRAQVVAAAGRCRRAHQRVARARPLRFPHDAAAGAVACHHAIGEEPRLPLQRLFERHDSKAEEAALRQPVVLCPQAVETVELLRSDLRPQPDRAIPD
jgi:hypothetical protein